MKYILFKDGVGFARYIPDDGSIEHTLNYQEATEACLSDWSDVLAFDFGNYHQLLCSGSVEKLDAPATSPASNGSAVHVQPSELLRKGGAWLAACREWIQWNLPEGDTVTWGSTDRIRGGISVRQLEELAAHVAADVMNHPPNESS